MYAVKASPADLIQNDGKFIAREVGISQFSVLNCFCAKHDKELFAAIEDEPLVFSPKQLSLLHYRTVASELYRKVMGHRATLHHLSAKSEKRPVTAEVKAAIQLLRDYSLGEQMGIRDIGAAFALAEKELLSENQNGISALIVHFKQLPSIMTVGGFLPECDYNGKPLQRLGDFQALNQGISFNILSAEGHAALAMLWLKGHDVAKTFAESFIAQEPERFTTLAIQTAFEHLENTCMAPNWWTGLLTVKQDLLLRRMQTAGSFMEERKPNCLTYCGVTFDQWEYDRQEFINV